jgi:uncharacterized membrane protein
MGGSKVKHLTSLLLFLLPLTITYAVVSSIGTEGNHYSAPNNAAVSHQGLSQPNGK